MDPVTDVLSGMRVRAVCHARFEGEAPWAIAWSGGAHAAFGFVLEGSAWLRLPEQDSALTAGDFFLLSPGRELTVQDGPGERDPVRPGPCHGETIRVGRGPGNTAVLAGRFHFEDNAAPGLILPPALVIPASQARELALGTALDLLAAESVRTAPGAELATQRLADLILIQAMRAYLTMPGGPEAGWLRALADPQAGAAIRAIHEGIEQPWTVASLAAAARMSRSAFALRFKELTGVAPLDYVTRWRMLRASRLLRETDRKLADIAQSVGYDSDAAFIKAFKRVLGLAPGEYRRMAA